MSCSPQGLGDGNYARLKLGDRIQVMIVRKYKLTLTRIATKEMTQNQRKVQIIPSVFLALSFYLRK